MGTRFWTAALLALSMPLAAHAASYKVNFPCVPRHYMITHNGDVVLTACGNQRTSFKIDAIALPSGHVLRSWPFVPGRDTYAIGVSRDGRYLALATPKGRISIYSIHGKGKRTFKAAPDPELLNFMRDDRLIVSRTLWDVSAKRPLHTFKTDFGPINAVARSADDSQLATGGGDTVIRLYNAHSLKLTHRYTGLKYEPFALAFVNNGKQLAVSGGDDRVVVLDTATGRAVKTLPRSGPAGAIIGGMGPVGTHGWFAVAYINPRSNKAAGYGFVNLSTGASEPACAGADRLRVTDSGVWCYRIKGRTLVANSTTPPRKE